MADETKPADLAALLGKRGKPLPLRLEIPTYPGHPIGLRPLTERETEQAHDNALAHCRGRGLFGGGDEESAASLSQVLGTGKGRDVADKRARTVGAMAMIATSELGYAIQCEEVTFALCVGPGDLRPLVHTSDELRDTLERSEIEYLAGRLEQFMRDRAPQRVHLTRQQVKEVVSSAKKGQRPTVEWSNCDLSTLLDFVTISVETLVTSGSATSTSSTSAGSPSTG